jgi:hypothetical protein
MGKEQNIAPLERLSHSLVTHKLLVGKSLIGSHLAVLRVYF